MERSLGKAPATGASQGRELPTAFHLSQRTPFESSPRQSSWDYGALGIEEYQSQA